MTSSSTPTVLMENEVNTSIHGQDNPSFLIEDADVEIKQFNNFSNHIHNLRVSFRRNSLSVDIDQPDDPLEPFDNNDNNANQNHENEQSPYEEVAANVSNKDDPTMLVLTFRSWFLGLAFTCLLSFINQFFAYRTSPLMVGVLVAQLLSHLLGKLMAKILPTKKFKIFRWNFTLNPGPFTVKEHCIITTMASTACVSDL